MSISAPVLSLATIAPPIVQVEHTASTSFAAPSTAWASSRIFVRDVQSDQIVVDVSVVAAGVSLVNLGPLTLDRFYRISAVAISDAGEISGPSNELDVTVSSNPLSGTLADFVRIPNPDPNASVMPHHAAAKYLEAVAWPLQDGSVLLLGVNLFIDRLPKEYYDQDSGYRLDPDTTLVLLQYDSGLLLLPHSIRHRQEEVIRISTFDGRTDRARYEASKLHLFFLRPENAAFESDLVSVRNSYPLEKPSLVEVDDAGVVQFSFRLHMQTVDLCVTE